MLRSLPEATIEQLAAGHDRRMLDAGALVFAQGDKGEDFYVIKHGRADVIGDGRWLRTLGPGDGFGEIALVRGCPRTTSVRAATNLTLGRVNHRHFVTVVAATQQAQASP